MPDEQQQDEQVLEPLFSDDSEETPEQPAAPEAKTEEKPEEQDRLEKSYTDLDKREKALLQKQAALEEAAGRLDEYDALISAAQSNPQDVLRALKIDPQALAGQLLGTLEPKKEPEPKDEIAVLKRELSELKNFKHEFQQQRTADVELSKIRKEIQEGDHETVRAVMEENPAVVNAILNEAVRRYKRDRVAPSYSELVKEFEEHYTNDLFQRVEKLWTLNKIKSKFGNLNPSEKAAIMKGEDDIESQTLTNDLQTSAPTIEDGPPDGEDPVQWAITWAKRNRNKLWEE